MQSQSSSFSLDEKPRQLLLVISMASKPTRPERSFQKRRWADSSLVGLTCSAALSSDHAQQRPPKHHLRHPFLDLHRPSGRPCLKPGQRLPAFPVNPGLGKKKALFSQMAGKKIGYPLALHRHQHESSSCRGHRPAS